MHQEGGNLYLMNTAKWFITSSSSLGSIADRGTFTKTDKSGELSREVGAKPPWTEQRSGLVTRVRYQDKNFSWCVIVIVIVLARLADWALCSQGCL